MNSEDNTSNEHHKEIDLIPLYVNKVLEKQERDTLESHIESCEICKRELKFEQTLQSTINETKEDLLSEKMSRNLALFNKRLDDEAQVTQKNTLPTENKVIKNKDDSASKKILQFIQSLIPVSNPALGGALAMGFAAVLGIGIFLQYPKGSSTPANEWDPSSLVRGCGEEKG